MKRSSKLIEFWRQRMAGTFSEREARDTLYRYVVRAFRNRDDWGVYDQKAGKFLKDATAVNLKGLMDERLEVVGEVGGIPAL